MAMQPQFLRRAARPCSRSFGTAGAAAVPKLRAAPAPAASSTTLPSTSASVQQLQSWLQSNNVATDKISLSPGPSGTPRLVAAKDIPAGESILTVPDALWISQAAVKKHPLGPAVEGLEVWVQIALILLSERFGAQQSPKGSAWAAYAAALPDPIDSPLLWSEQQQAAIQGTQLLQSLQAYKSFFASKFQALQQERFQRNPAAFPPSVFTPDNFLWAVVAVRSRVHTPLDADKLALVPLADMVSHSRNANVSWRLRASGLFSRDQSLSVEASRPLRQGEVLHMDFGVGKLDNEVLLDYGVLDVANSKGGYSLALTMPASDRNFDDKLDVLELAGLGATSSFTLTSDKPPQDDMLAFLRLMNLQGADTFLLESVFRNDVWGHMQQPVAQDNEAAVCVSMIQGASEALAGYGTTIEQDLALLRSGQLVKGGVEEQALLVRLGEKEALDAALRFFENREALLPTLEFYQERRLKRLGLLDDKGNTTYDSFFDKGIA